jgi:hypothetical protein
MPLDLAGLDAQCGESYWIWPPAACVVVTLSGAHLGRSTRHRFSFGVAHGERLLDPGVSHSLRDRMFCDAVSPLGPVHGSADLPRRAAASTRAALSLLPGAAACAVRPTCRSCCQGKHMACRKRGAKKWGHKIDCVALAKYAVHIIHRPRAPSMPSSRRCAELDDSQTAASTARVWSNTSTRIGGADASSGDLESQGDPASRAARQNVQNRGG